MRAHLAAPAVGAFLKHKLALIAVAALSVAAAGPEVPTDKSPAPVESPSGRAQLVPLEIPVALLVDLSTGQTLFARDAERRFVPASVTKVMTAYTAFRLIDEQNRIRPHVNVFLGEQSVRDLDAAVSAGSEIYIVGALSGG